MRIIANLTQSTHAFSIVKKSYIVYSQKTQKWLSKGEKWPLKSSEFLTRPIMNKVKTITELGLDEKTARVYVALLELGVASMTDLAQQAELKRPTVYLAVEELKKHGLISEAKIGKRKQYSAIHPKRLVEIARSHERNIQTILPELTALHNAPLDKPKIQVFEGESGVKLIYKEVYESLSRQVEALWFTRIDALKKDLPYAANEYRSMLQKLNSPRIRELNYGNEAGKKWLNDMQPFLDKNPNHEIRLFPADFEFGFSDNLIFGDKMVIFSLKNNVFVTKIESAEITKTYRALFERCWEMAAKS